MRCKISFCVSALLAISTLSYANEKVVKVATLEDYAPFCITVGGIQKQSDNSSR